MVMKLSTVKEPMALMMDLQPYRDNKMIKPQELSMSNIPSVMYNKWILRKKP